MDKNDDTMTDLIFGMIGSLIFVGLRLIRNRFYKKIGIEKVEEKYLSEFKKIRKVL